MSVAVLSVVDFSCRFRAGGALALRKVNVEARPGEILLVCGASGSGKSSLAMSLVGLIPHEIRGSETAGRVVVCGADLREKLPSEIPKLAGVVLQDCYWQLLGPTVEDDIAAPLENFGFARGEMILRVEYVLAQLGLRALRSRNPNQLSGGEQQRVVLAAALALKPQLLILDEPLAELDPESKGDLLALLKELAREGKVAIVLLEHNLGFCVPIADRVLVLEAGKVIASGSPEILSDRALRTRAGLLEPMFGDQAVGVASSCEDGGSVTGAAQPDEGPGRPVPSCGRALPTGTVTPRAAVKQVSFAYKRRGSTCIRSLDLELAKGECAALIGNNGAGKSTLGKLLAGLLKPACGVIEIDGHAVRSLVGPARSAKVGYVFQNPDYQFFMPTVFEEAAFGLRQMSWDAAAIKERLDEILACVGLARHADVPPYFLSRGERRRLAVATVLAMSPALVILDEPTSGLDQRSASDLLDYVDRLRTPEQTVLLITHEMDVVLKRAQRAIVLVDGELIDDASPAVVLGKPDVVRAARLAKAPGDHGLSHSHMR